MHKLMYKKRKYGEKIYVSMPGDKFVSTSGDKQI